MHSPDKLAECGPWRIDFTSPPTRLDLRDKTKTHYNAEIAEVIESRFQVNSPGVIGGEAQPVTDSRAAARSRATSSTSCLTILAPSKLSSPENMGFIGVARASQLLGLLMTLAEDDSGGVAG